MSEERKKVLEMLAAGKITAEEAEKLLDKLNSNASNATPGAETPASLSRARNGETKISAHRRGSTRPRASQRARASFLRALRKRSSRHHAQARERAPRRVRHQRGHPSPQ